ncbi:DUF4190 domain-containing protein [Mycolicibacterium goodii]
MTDERAGEPGSDRPEPTESSGPLPEPGQTPDEPAAASEKEAAGSAGSAGDTQASAPGAPPYTYGPSQDSYQSPYQAPYGGAAPGSSYGQPPYGAYPGTYPGGYPPQSPYGGYPPQSPHGGYPPQSPGPMATGPRNGLGVAALIAAIAGLVLCWSIIGGIVVGAVAIVLGFLGQARAKRGEATNGGVAVTGIVLGGIAVVLSLAFIAIWVTLGVRWFEDLGGREYLNCLEDAGNDQAAQERCRVRFEERVEDEFGTPSTRTR